MVFDVLAALMLRPWEPLPPQKYYDCESEEPEVIPNEDRPAD
jgi:hypothetical protein